MKNAFLLSPKPLVLAMAMVGNVAYADDLSQDIPVKLAPLMVTAEQSSSPYHHNTSSSATGLKLTLQETPQSVSVMTKTLLQDIKSDTVEDALRYGTAMNVDKANGRFSRITARGFSHDNFQVNGVSVFDNYSLTSDTDNTAIYERIEITRGATGLLTGIGEPSASINLIRKQANSKSFRGGVDLEVGAWGHKKVSIDGQSPLTADGFLRGRAVISYLDTNTFRDREHKKQGSVYATLDADVGDDTELSLGLSYEKRRIDGAIWADLPVFFSDGTRTHWKRNQSTAPHWNLIDTSSLKVFLDTKHQFDNGWQWSNATLYSTAKENTLLLGIEGNLDKKTGLGMKAEPWAWQQNPKHFQLNSKLSMPFYALDYPQEINLGATVSRTKGGWLGGNEDFTNADEVKKDLSNFYVWHGDYPKPIVSQLSVASGHIDHQYALYLASRLQLAKPIKLILGGRFTHYKKDYQGDVWGTPAYIQKENVLTPYLGVVYDLNKGNMLYASYTNIFQPQDSKDKNGQFLSPIKGNSYEIGLKNQWLDGNLNTNLSLYQTVQDNFAQPDGKIAKTDQTAFKAIKGATVRGIEAEVAGRITPNWNLMASLTAFYANKTPDGEHLIAYSPRKNMKLLTKYDLSAYVHGLSVGAGAQWYDQPPIIAENPKTYQSQKVGQPAYALMDLMAHYRVNDQLSMQLNVNNVLDKSYYYINWGETLNYGEPRNFKVSLNYQF